MIDFTNLAEWHTAKDDLNIIDPDKIKNLGTMFLSFLNQPQLNVEVKK